MARLFVDPVGGARHFELTGRSNADPYSLELLSEDLSTHPPSHTTTACTVRKISEVRDIGPAMANTGCFAVALGIECGGTKMSVWNGKIQTDGVHTHDIGPVGSFTYDDKRAGVCAIIVELMNAISALMPDDEFLQHAQSFRFFITVHGRSLYGAFASIPADDLHDAFKCADIARRISDVIYPQT